MTQTQSVLRRFLVLKSFDWEGKSCRRGDHLNIPDGHPRIGTMAAHRFMRYDPLRDDETPERSQPATVPETAPPAAPSTEFRPTG